MDGQELHDTLLGFAKRRINGRAQSASQKASQANGSGAKAKAEPKPADETALDAAQAVNLREVTGAAFLYWVVSSSLTNGIGTEAFQVYRDELLRDAGNPSDPLEVMLIEQLALAHFSIGQLRIKSCALESPKLAIAYSDSATRLLGEFRRCTLALEDYRTKQAARKDQAARPDAVETAPPPNSNGRSQPSSNGKRKPTTARLGTNGEIPQCLKDRMQPPIPVASQLAASTGGNGKA